MRVSFYENYFRFCNYFDGVALGCLKADVLPKMARQFKIKFSDFCDANGFTESRNWKEAIEEYKEQIKCGERG